ncbi:MAG TPA: helix-hairpin-helix domain-containing protein [Candidatus Limnocylindria bacterium]|nr:helix-hairpin-helix domain-containing protein [Candidatus Limnocylindria bacterium]
MPLNDRVLLAGIGGSLLLALVAGWLLVAGSGPNPLASATATDGASSATTGGALATASHEPAAGTDLVVVDVEGGVAEPGIQHLPDGSRVADAIFAAGGYGPTADLAAAARELNLAAKLSDGQQVYVPQVGDGAKSGGSPDAGSGAGGLVNLNRATPEELDALPGIGPVTVQKIVAARQEQPFRTIDELVQRKILTAAQLSKVRDQVTV